VTAGDFNGDGKPDLAVANYGSTNVSVMLGNGDGTFQPALNYDVTGRLPVSVVGADFNGDGMIDFAVANRIPPVRPLSVSILFGHGDGGFEQAVDYGAGPDSLVLLNTCGVAELGIAYVRSNTNLTLSWPFPSTGFILESATSLRLTNWQSAAETVLTNKGHLEVLVPLDKAERYFRLRGP
jgi:hypothetical protein